MDRREFLSIEVLNSMAEIIFRISSSLAGGTADIFPLQEAIRILWFHGRSWWHASAKLD